MTLLLDTHTLLWFLKDDPLLSVAAKTLILDPVNHKFVSIATCWEIAIKAAIGKLTLTEPCGVLLSRELSRNGFDLLAIELRHARRIAAGASQGSVRSASCSAVCFGGDALSQFGYPVRRLRRTTPLVTCAERRDFSASPTRTWRGTRPNCRFAPLRPFGSGGILAACRVAHFRAGFGWPRVPLANTLGDLPCPDREPLRSRERP